MAKAKKDIPKDDFEVFLKKVGNKIRKLRIAKGYSNYEHFAYDHDIARAQYGKYEQGKDDLRLGSLYKVLKSLDISFEEFFSDDF
ncbi:helix-turn-helix transcriptional regulator [Terrimonas sp. NA20]|uniref:Helix-turn-helix transcriptional regulator n=1 Tax=Terrimonas ginsenosidimutans TaxID=2908004 RepID=A0ABS9KK25_9BACT|nr:helix-turn-helix transcriptional regulator [Terrimonas ginsenosidimutans]MCG2612669.1 helix-turn-helix transcriptional regulator [Terrimonas ginsenosidimutans]